MIIPMVKIATRRFKRLEHVYYYAQRVGWAGLVKALNRCLVSLQHVYLTYEALDIPNSCTLTVCT